MSSILAANVTFSTTGRSASPEIDDSGGKYKKVEMQFGNATLTYPTGGIPMSGLANVGFPYTVGQVIISDESNGDGYVYKWDSVNNKLRIYNIGVISSTPTTVAPLTEVTTSYAPAATTLYLRVYGH